jgi:SAM-dependent methyltransferase
MHLNPEEAVMESADRTHAGTPCLICGESALRAVPGFAALPRISSDCRSFAAGGELAVCGNCAMVQKIPDARWLAEIAAIYSGYAAYSLAGGEEQLVLDPRTGTPRKRSEVLMSALQEGGGLSGIARALDVGCGHGVTLMAMANAFPGWELFGHELDASKEEALRRITGFRQLHTGDFSTIEQTFDFISMIHSLEHFVEPLQTLRLLRGITNPGGRLFVEVCNVDENPFDLLVADHLSHFSPASLAFAASRAGYLVSRVETAWVKKEVSLLAIRAADETHASTAPPPDGREAHARITASVDWLESLISTARATANRSGSFGIFGTSIAGTWLAAALGDAVAFFVDEDPHRIGREYMGKPVLAPQAVASGSTVFLALAPTLAQAIGRRLSQYPLELVVPDGI